MGCGQGGRLLLLILFTCVEFLTICVHNFFLISLKRKLVLKKRRKEKNKKMGITDLKYSHQMTIVTN